MDEVVWRVTELEKVGTYKETTKKKLIGWIWILEKVTDLDFGEGHEGSEQTSPS